MLSDWGLRENVAADGGTIEARLRLILFIRMRGINSVLDDRAMRTLAGNRLLTINPDLSHAAAERMNNHED